MPCTRHNSGIGTPDSTFDFGYFSEGLPSAQPKDTSFHQVKKYYNKIVHNSPPPLFNQASLITIAVE